MLSKAASYEVSTNYEEVADSYRIAVAFTAK